MDIEDRLHEAGQRWRESQGPALKPPNLADSTEKVYPRWRHGLIPLAAAAAAAAIAIGFVSLHGQNTASPATRPAQATPGPVQTATPTSSSRPTTTAAILPTQSPVVPSKATAAPTSAMDANIQLYGDCRTPTIKPVIVRLTCGDGGLGLMNLRWTRWASSGAQGIGTLWYNECVPTASCGPTQFHYFPNTRVTLSSPVRDIHGQLVWSKIQETPLPPGLATGPQPFPTRPI